MRILIPLLLLAAALAPLSEIFRLLWEHTQRRAEWTTVRATLRAMGDEIRPDFEIQGKPQTFRMATPLSGVQAFESFDLLVDPEHPDVAAQRSYLALWGPLLWLLVSGLVLLAISGFACHLAYPAEGSTEWRLGQALAPELETPARFVLHEAPGAWKANLFWAALGLLGFIPVFYAGRGPVLGATWIGLLLLYAWHNATLEVRVSGEGIVACSALGSQVIPMRQVASVESAEWRQESYSPTMRKNTPSLGSQTFRSFKIKDQDGDTLMSLAFEMQPPPQEAVEFLRQSIQRQR